MPIAPLTRSRPIKFPVRGSTGLNFVLTYHGFSKRRCFSLFSLTAPPPPPPLPPTHYVTRPTSSTTVCNTATGVSILELATKVTPVSRLLPRHSKSPSKLSLAVHCEPLIDKIVSSLNFLNFAQTSPLLRKIILVEMFKFENL